MSKKTVDQLSRDIDELTAEIASCRKDDPEVKVLKANLWVLKNKLWVEEANVSRELCIKKKDDEGAKLAAKKVDLALQQLQIALGK